MQITQRGVNKNLMYVHYHGVYIHFSHLYLTIEKFHNNPVILNFQQNAFQQRGDSPELLVEINDVLETPASFHGSVHGSVNSLPTSHHSSRASSVKDAGKVFETFFL